MEHGKFFRSPFPRPLPLAQPQSQQRDCARTATLEPLGQVSHNASVLHSCGLSPEIGVSLQHFNELLSVFLPVCLGEVRTSLALPTVCENKKASRLKMWILMATAQVIVVSPNGTNLSIQGSPVGCAYSQAPLQRRVTTKGCLSDIRP